MLREDASFILEEDLDILYNEDRGAYGAEAEEAALAHLQEQGFNAVRTKDYLGEEWTPKLDAEMGDILLLNPKNGEIVSYIDAKRALQHQGLELLGTVSKTEASDAFRARNNSFYYLYNKDLSYNIIIKANTLRPDPRFGKFWTTDEELEAEQVEFPVVKTN